MQLGQGLILASLGKLLTIPLNKRETVFESNKSISLLVINNMSLINNRIFSQENKMSISLIHEEKSKPINNYIVLTTNKLDMIIKDGISSR